MVNLIQMAHLYKTRPSKLLNIEYDLLAYMIDEFSIFLVQEVTNKNGDIEWNKIKTKQDVISNNDFMQHLKEQRR